jgi:CPA2 family monovalent cation:H+ antiporter-2
VGYLLGGVAIGPYTPGLVADASIALELAEIGVGLLMFAVGLHFSIADLLSVRRLALPGAVAQIVVAVVLGTGVGIALGSSLSASIVMGLAISVASTVVLLRALTQRDLLTTDAGRVAVGWLIVEDVFTVLVVVLLPSVAAMMDEGATTNVVAVVSPIAIATTKAAALTAIMLVLGPRILPRSLAFVERMGSRELFTIAVLAIALAMAFAAAVVFDVSLALGAFLAGAVLSESRLSDKAADDVVALTDVFTVLFFVSIGMLLDPAIVVDEALTITAVLAVIMVGKALAAIAIVAIRRAPLRTGLTVAAGLAQIGEFSFIVAAAALELELITETTFQVIVAAALLSITANPFLYPTIDPWLRWVGARPRLARILRADEHAEVDAEVSSGAARP